MATATTATKATKPKATPRGARKAGEEDMTPIPSDSGRYLAANVVKGEDGAATAGESLDHLGEIVRFDVTWGDLDEFPVVVTDRSNEAKLLASRRWLAKWERSELSFKGIVIYTCPPGWEANDFLC
jgi:hypothetical protein